MLQSRTVPGADIHDMAVGRSADRADSMKARAKGTNTTDDRLLAAATSAFASAGIEAANVESIATDANVSKNYIYSRYAGKVELYASIRRRLDESFYRTMLDLDLACHAPLDAIEAYLLTLYACLDQHPAHAAMMRDQLIHGTRVFTPAPHIAASLLELRGRISMLLDRGRADGSIRCAWNGETFLFLSVFVAMGAISNVEVAGSLLGRRAFAEPGRPRAMRIVDLFRRVLQTGTLLSSDLAPVGISAAADDARPPNRICRILQAAELCFGRTGLDRTSLAEVSAVAGVSPQLMYYYFEGKLDLFTAVTGQIAERTVPQLSELDFEGMPPIAAVEAFLTLWWRQYAEHPRWAVLAIDHSLHADRIKCTGPIATQRNLLLRRLDAALDRGRAAGTVHASIDAATLCFLGIALIPLAVAVLTPPAEDRSRLHFPLLLDPAAIIGFILGAAGA